MSEQKTNGQASKAIVTGPAKRLADIQGEVLKAKSSLTALLPKHTSPDRMIRSVTSALSRTPALLDCDPRSVVLAAAQLCAIGLEPNTPTALAYLVPFKNRTTGKTECQAIIGYRGFIRLAFQSGELADIYAECVYEKDIFERTLGTTRSIHHVPFDGDDRGAIVGVYAVAVMKGEFRTFVYLSRAEVQKIKAVSQTGDSGPWGSWEDAMWKKTAIKQLAKYLPLSEEKGAGFFQAVHQDDKQMAGEPDFSNVVDVLPEEPAVTRTESLVDRLETKAVAS